MFAGPVSESVPTSTASFVHRRARADSTASFTYFQEAEDSQDWLDDEAAVYEFDDDYAPEECTIDVDSGEAIQPKRRSSGFSRISIEEPLLVRHDSRGAPLNAHIEGGRTSQKLYILTEDLTIAIAGFSTSLARATLYTLLCTSTLGVAYLVFRWLPRWRISLVGSPTPLRECAWVVVEVGGQAHRKLGDFS